ncbi:sigma 54-interacting transcriptional regulator [Thermodesulfobacteriota bacterium]
MSEIESGFYRILFEDLDPENMRKRFLRLLLRMQNVERGSIWVKKEKHYLCVESLGSPEDKDIIKGKTIGFDTPSIVDWVMKHNEMTIVEVGKDSRHYSRFEEGMKLKSTWIIAFPLVLQNGEVYGVLEIIDTKPGPSRLNTDKDYLELLKHIVDMGSIALSNALNYNGQLKKNLQLEQTLDELRSEVQIIGQSNHFIQVMKKVRDYAGTDFPVLITGESGTGKDLIAAAIHKLSTRKDKPFVVQNCSAIPETLLESELFGYKKGAFTGAAEDRIGLFKSADGGTIFLDEIGDMSLQLQARILRVIQNSEIKPLGDTKTSRLDVRIIAATNKNLDEAVKNRDFREDLFYRLNVLPLYLPSLKERKKDIPLLINYFLKRQSLEMGISQKRISKAALKYMEDYQWEGNIRELENCLKYILSTVDDIVVGVNDIPDYIKQGGSKEHIPAGISDELEKQSPSERTPLQEKDEKLFAGYTWQELEKGYVLYLLNKNKWNVSRAAEEAGLNRSTFDSRRRKLGISSR